MTRRRRVLREQHEIAAFVLASPGLVDKVADALVSKGLTHESRDVLAKRLNLELAKIASEGGGKAMPDKTYEVKIAEASASGIASPDDLGAVILGVGVIQAVVTCDDGQGNVSHFDVAFDVRSVERRP